jgi:hypothetical protein
MLDIKCNENPFINVEYIVCVQTNKQDKSCGTSSKIKKIKCVKCTQ